MPRLLILLAAAVALASGASAQHTEQGDASAVFAQAQDAGARPIAGSLIRVDGVGDADTYAVCSPWTTTIIDRWVVDTEIVTIGSPRATEAFVSRGPTLGDSFMATTGLGDLRSNFAGPLGPAECTRLGMAVSTRGWPMARYGSTPRSHLTRTCRVTRRRRSRRARCARIAS